MGVPFPILNYQNIFEEPAKHIGSTRHFTGSEGEAFGLAAMGPRWTGKWLAAPIHPWGMRDASKTAHLQSCHFSEKKNTDFLGIHQFLWSGRVTVTRTVYKSSTGQTKIIELTHTLFCHPLRWLMLSTRNIQEWICQTFGSWKDGGVFLFLIRLVSHKTCSKKYFLRLCQCRHVKSP